MPTSGGRGAKISPVFPLVRCRYVFLVEGCGLGAWKISHTLQPVQSVRHIAMYGVVKLEDIIYSDSSQLRMFVSHVLHVRIASGQHSNF